MLRDGHEKTLMAGLIGLILCDNGICFDCDRRDEPKPFDNKTFISGRLVSQPDSETEDKLWYRTSTRFYVLLSQ